MAATVRLGTCSWADRGLLQSWYPPAAASAEARLRYYAGHFDCVEVDSSYYAIPDAATVARWADRTPPGFTFHVKAFGLMTGHRVTPEQLPPDLRPGVAALLPNGGVAADPALRARVFRRFRAALAPLRTAGKLGGVLLQYPPGFRPGGEAQEALLEAREHLEGDEVLVEFRHRGWLERARIEETLSFLEQHRLTYVTVDAPRLDAPNVAPTVVAATTRTAYVRFHGRNAATWNVTGGRADDRFDHRYSEQELGEWVPALRDLAGTCERVYGMFNTNRADQGPANAETLRALLARADVPVAAASGAGGQQATLF